jgi:hypothetical protein
MTAAGPVILTWPEVLAQLPAVDPSPCSRVQLLDQDAIDKVRRSVEVFHLLRSGALGWHEREQRAALLVEQKQLDDWRKREGLEPLAHKRRLDGE